VKINSFRQNLASEEERKLMAAMYGVIGQWLLVLSLFEDLSVKVVIGFAACAPFFKAESLENS
jgi:hypothetical protein